MNKRSSSQYINLRNYHNGIKFSLLSEYEQDEGYSLFDVSIGRGGCLPNFARTNVKTLVGIDPCQISVNIAKKRYKNMKIPIKKTEWISPFLPTEQFHFKMLKITKEGKYSITKWEDSFQIVKLIESFCGDTTQLTITDCNGGIGGDTITFCKNFKFVNSIELKENHYNILEYNCKLYGIKNLNIYNCDSTKVLDLEQDVVYFDPPWGGKKYHLENKIFFKEPFTHILFNKIKAKICVIKIPINFDIIRLVKHIDKQIWKYWKIYNLYSFNIIVLYKEEKERILSFTRRLKPKCHKNTFNIFRNICITDNNAELLLTKWIGDYKFNVVSCQFTLHYFFEKPSMLENAIKNISNSLENGGRFIGTSIDGNKVQEAVKDNNLVDSDYYIISREYPYEPTDLYGNKYYFKLKEKNNTGTYFDFKEEIPEYLVNREEFIRVCKKYNLKLIQIKEFSEYNHKEYELSDYEYFISFLYFSFIFEKDLDY